MKRGRSGGPPSRTQRDAYRARVDREAAAIILQDELDAAGRRRPCRDARDRTGDRHDDDPLRRTPTRRRRRPPTSADATSIPTPTRPRRRRITASRSAAATATAAVAAGGGEAAGSVGFLKFLVFALVLAAIVLVVALTALRPLVETPSILTWAEDNPAALAAPVRHGHRPRGPGHGTDRRPRRPTRRRSSSRSSEGDTAAIDRRPARGGGPARRPPGVRVHRHRARADRDAPAGRRSSCART